MCESVKSNCLYILYVCHFVCMRVYGDLSVDPILSGTGLKEKHLCRYFKLHSCHCVSGSSLCVFSVMWCVVFLKRVFVCVGWFSRC